jgi:hypothetical protein
MFLRMTKRATTTSRGLKPSHGLTAVEHDVLIVLFQLSRDTQHISAQTLAEAVHHTPTQTGAALVRLERRGLVDATRARLTMMGLMLATRLGAGSGGPRVAVPAVAKFEGARAELPVAALPSQPPPARREPVPSVPVSYERETSIGLLS